MHKVIPVEYSCQILGSVCVYKAYRLAAILYAILHSSVPYLRVEVQAPSLSWRSDLHVCRPQQPGNAGTAKDC